ncbi:YrhK family protein [Flexistipes sp.]|uniref:YrhK family protein n=1 Tax=Flexistipes sp. TaxID=3088135 RepID=UPI002E1CBB9D|nr:YrhK family protein [Flexistipes sp.]
MKHTDDRDITITLGKDRLVIQKRYKFASILNDFLIAVWFLMGSVMFLYPDWVKAGTWLFILGSAQLLIRPCIRLAHHIHLKKLPESHWEM